MNDEKSVSGELRSTAENLRSELADLEEKYSKQCRDYSECQHSLTRYVLDLTLRVLGQQILRGGGAYSLETWLVQQRLELQS